MLKRSSIGSIAYEYDFYTLSDDLIHTSIEKHLNREFETPLTQSELWRYIREDKPEQITEDHKVLLYLFMRHLLSRNNEQLAILEYIHNQIFDPKHSDEYSLEEKQMHKSLSVRPGGPRQFFLENIDNIDFYMSEYHRASISIFKSEIDLRTSTFPIMPIPRFEFSHPNFKPNDTVHWLPLSPKFGAQLVMCDAYSEFSEMQVLNSDVARVYNRGYLTQLWSTLSVRHMIHSNDEYIEEDFKWAELQQDSVNQRKYRLHDRTRKV